MTAFDEKVQGLLFWSIVGWVLVVDRGGSPAFNGFALGWIVLGTIVYVYMRWNQ